MPNLRLQLLAFSGQQQRTPPALLEEFPVTPCREALSVRPNEFPLIVPRKALVFVFRKTSAEAVFPFKKEAQTFP